MLGRVVHICKYEILHYDIEKADGTAICP